MSSADCKDSIVVSSADCKDSIVVSSADCKDRIMVSSADCKDRITVSSADCKDRIMVSSADCKDRMMQLAPLPCHPVPLSTRCLTLSAYSSLNMRDQVSHPSKKEPVYSSVYFDLPISRQRR